jgi:RNA polymerase sigma-70 factor (ECF subfamily)
MEPDRDDEDALLVAAADDAEAFARFYRLHVRGVVAYFRRRVGDAELAADLTAETFAAALEGRRRYAPERGPAAAWLYGIARRQLVTFHRRGHVERRARRRLGMARIELTDEMLERVEALADAELAQVDVALAALPDDQQAAVRARIVEDHDYDQIAAAQSISEPAARQRVSRGLAALRARMRSQEQQP